jgi:hypothetical protein
MIVTLTPNPSVDRTLFLDAFTRGAVNRCTATLAEPSGKGINVALALHSRGVPVLAVLPIGGSAGEQLVQLLDAAGLPYRAVTIAGIGGLSRSGCQRLTTRRSACLGVAVGRDSSPTPGHAALSSR